MKTRIFLSTLLLIVLLTSLALPALAQGPTVDVVEPAPDKALPEGKGLPEYPGLPHQAGLDGVGTDYVWSQTLGTYTEITGGTVHGTASNDDQSFSAVNLGFTFTYNGVDYTQVSIQNNGFVALGATVSSSYTPLSSGATNNVAAILGRDLQGNGTTSELMSMVEGTSPNQVFTIQWKHYKRYGTSYVGDDFNMQIKLYETSNLVQYVYGPFTAVYNAAPPTVQVGIRGASNADFLNRKTGATGWTDTLPGALNTDYMNLTDLIFPPNGLTWDWSIIVGPNLSQSTKAAPGKVVFGEPIEYTIEILNTGLTPALGASLVDPIPAGTVYNDDVACSSGQCWYDNGAVYWAGQVATPPKAAWQPPQNAGGRQAKGPDGPANPTGERSVFPKVNGTVLLDQQPNQTNGVFSDASCDLCGGAQVLAENFLLEDTATLEQVAFWTGYYPGDAPIDPDAIRVLIHQDAAGLPGAVVYDESNVAYTRAQTGVILFGVHEYVHTLTLGTPAVLPAGTYWIEIYNDTGFGTDDMFWEVGNADTIGRGLLDTAFAFEAPGSAWYYPNGTEMAFQLIGTIGAQQPENPVTVTFSVTPENPECGMLVVNEATIDDPEIPAPVVVQATTEVWEMVLLHEDFEGDVFPPAGWVEAHDPAGMAWTDQDLEPRGNLTGGTGKFAIVDDDYGGSAALTTAQLWTPPFDIPAGGYATQLLFKTDYNNISTSEQADVDISLDGGATWTNVLHWNTDHRGPLTQSVDLSAFAGATGAILRFYYYDGGVYAWWWEIDDVQVVACYVAEPDIAVDPTSLEQTLCPDQTAVQELHICNWGDMPLTWTLNEVVPPEGVQAVLYDNGPLVTHPGGGYSGADASALQTALGMTIYGFGNQYLNGNHMADDFEVTDPAGWNIQQVTFFAYQTGTYGFPPVSTITGLYFQIWDGPPNDPGSAVVFGDMVTNRLASTSWPGVYRVLDTDMLNQQRPPMANVGTAGVVLPPGTYWLDWMTDGSLASGPWAPPISILGQTTTGNALQYTSTGWAAAVDGTWQQGMPFVIEGEVAGPPPDLTWLTEDPLAGTVEPGTCQTVNVTFDSTGLAAGTYTGALDIHSNDPDTPVVTVPVTLTVEECGVDTMHIGDLTGNLALDPYGRTVARWYVLTHDAAHSALALVTVDASIWDPISGPYVRTRLTHYTGWARFHWGRDAAGPFQLCVDNLAKAGYTYAPADNDVPNCLPLP